VNEVTVSETERREVRKRREEVNEEVVVGPMCGVGPSLWGPP